MIVSFMIIFILLKKNSELLLNYLKKYILMTSRANSKTMFFYVVNANIRWER